MYVTVRTFLVASVVTVLLTSGQATALEVYANTGPGATGVNISGGGTPSRISLAQGFKTGGSTNNLTLQSVQMAFNFQLQSVTGFSPDQYLKIGLYSSTSTTLKTPDTLIGSFKSTPNEAFATINEQKLYTFNYLGSQPIAPNTEYWVVVSSDRGVSTASFNWGFAAGTPPESAIPVAVNNSGYSYVGTVGQNSVGSWVDYAVGSPTVASGVRFGVTVVPEPSTYALGIVGTLVIGAIARRKSHKPAMA